MARTRKQATNNGNGNGAKRLATQQSVDQAVKAICDIMRRGNRAGAMQYVPELTWILFLRILDEQEEREAQEAEALGVPFAPSLEEPYRWRDWGAPLEGPPAGAMNKRAELQGGTTNALFQFINSDLLPHLRGLSERPNATARQKIISQIMSAVERVGIDTERNFLDVCDRVHQLTTEAVDPTHVFTLSQVYEGLLLRMGEKGNDGGQFFTPREVIRAMVRVIDPRAGEQVYDPCCGTGGFLAQAYEHMSHALGAGTTGPLIEALKHDTFYGREKENLVYPIALANLVLHGIDRPNLWHGNTLTGQEIYGGLFEDAPPAYDVILTNPPFGGKEGKEAQTNFAYRTGATQVLFLQHIIDRLKAGGRCGMVVDEGTLFRTNEDAFVRTKRKLLDECDLWCVVSLPGGVFTAAGAGVKTDLLFFTRGAQTHRIWYYDLTDVKVGKKTPLTLAHFDELFALLPARADSEHSWTVDLDERKRVAAEEARPFREQGAAAERQVREWTVKVKDLKRARFRDPEVLAGAEAQLSTFRRAAREAAARAKQIEDAVYDLKAVNPHRVVAVDARTPEDLIAEIERYGREIAEAMEELRGIDEGH